MGTKATARVKRYKEKVYDQIRVEAPKELVSAFKEKCKAEGVSQASILKKAMADFVGVDE